MVPLRRLISSVLMFSLLPSVFHGPLRSAARADETTDQPLGLQFRLSHGSGQSDVRPGPSPVAEALGQRRILRTSPLTEVPFVCCTNY